MEKIGHWLTIQLFLKKQEIIYKSTHVTRRSSIHINCFSFSILIRNSATVILSAKCCLGLQFM